jgi:hypothetical protein
MSVISTLNSPLYTTFPLFTPLFTKYLHFSPTLLHRPFRWMSSGDRVLFGWPLPEKGSKKPSLIKGLGWAVGS